MTSTDIALQAIAEMNSIGVAIVKESGELTFANAAFRKLVSIENEFGLLQEILPVDIRATVGDVLKREGVHHFSFEIEAGFCELVVAVGSATPESGRNIVGILVPKQGDSAALKAIGQVTGKYGHDLNNLLGAILGSVDLLEHKLQKELGSKDLPVARQLKIIKSSVARAVALTGQMRGYARREPALIGSVCLQTVLEGLVTLMDELAALPVDVILDTRTAHPIQGNAYQLSHAFQSILLNSCEALRQESDRCIAVVLDMTESESREFMQVLFIDHGTGMDEGKLKKAFNPFFSSRSPGSLQGLGLGLSMARQIILDHGGSIDIHSAAGVGTAVRVLLPVRGVIED